MRILDDLPNEIARQSIDRVSRVGVSHEFMTIVADQTVFSAQPDEALGVLQHRHNRALRHPFRGRQMLKDEGRRIGRSSRHRRQHPTFGEGQ